MLWSFKFAFSNNKGPPAFIVDMEQGNEQEGAGDVKVNWR